MKDLFPLKLTKSKKPQGLLIPKCEACGLYKTCKSPQMPVDGEGKLKVLVVGEAPGSEEDRSGKPFVGPAGQVLQKALHKAGVNLRRDCWVTNSLRCRPPSNEIKDERAIDYCRPYVRKAIEELKPEKIILLGSRAVESVIGWLWKPNPGGVYRWAGFQIPDRKTNSWICPTFHPSAVLRQKDPKVMRLLFEQHLADTFSLEGRPHEQVFHPKERVKLVYDEQDACNRLHRVIETGRPCAFDYETSHISPYSQGAYVLSCGISDGGHSFSFSITPGVIDSLKKFLIGPNKKIAHNAQFEWKWSLVHFGVEVEPLSWDCMIQAHALDNRKDITSLKFLSYSTLGYESYDDEVDAYKRGVLEGGRNRLHELPLAKLLLYNGLDALFTLELMQAQTKQVGLRL